MKDRITMVVVLIVSAALSALILGWIYNYTKPIVEINKEEKLKRTILDAFGMEYNDDTIIDSFDSNIEIFDKQEITYYRTFTKQADGEKQYSGIAVELLGSGFWATIKIVIALNDDMETIRGFTIVEQAETPGLGGRIVEPWFLDQFKGKKVKPALHIISNRQGDNPNEIDAITGATETSKALDTIINEGLANFFAQIDKSSLN